MKICNKETARLNCGCCEDIVLECIREDEHEGPHYWITEERGKTYDIWWVERSAT